VKELRDLYPSPSIIRMMTSRRMRCAKHVARIGQKRNTSRILVGKPEERAHWEDEDESGCTLL
jgi:hypothetical protein